MPGHAENAIASEIDQGIAALTAGDPVAAIDHLSRAASLDPAHRTAHNYLALALLLDGRLADGFREMHQMFPPTGTAPVYGGQALSGDTVVLYNPKEAGYGDTIQFARYAVTVAERGGRPVLLVAPQMARLMQAMPVPGMIVQSHAGGLPAEYFQAPFLDMGFICGTTLETIPARTAYLSGDPEPWRDFLAQLPGLRVGLCWAGNPRHVSMDRTRSMPFSELTPVFSVPGCSFVSLQVGTAASQRQAPVHPLPRHPTDWADTAGLVAGLDLIVTVDTAIAHLAGAMGKPVWLLNRFATDWRWMLHRSDSPWYPSMRIFRQGRHGDWKSVIARVACDLEAMAS
jgi:Glycosyltransferase family 9 (heptosyltransferase)